MSRPEFDSEFCNVKYIEEDRIILVSWKRPCHHDYYREPLFFALSLLQAFPKSTLVIDARVRFEIMRDDVDWNFSYLLHAMYKLTKKKFILITDQVSEDDPFINPWAGEFLKSFLVHRVTNYQDAVRANKRGIKQISNKLAGGLLLYELFMFAAFFVYMIILLIPSIVQSVNANNSKISTDHLTELLTKSGMPYIIAIVPGIFFLFHFFRKQRLKPVLFETRKTMSAKRFFLIFCVFMSAQTIFAVFSSAMEALFNQFGFSLMNSINSATSNSTTISMFIYASFLAPLTEEIIFRGFILKSLEKYGKMFAIFVSAILFGAMHANLIQSLFAFMIGLVLGYVAIEYSIKWTILLHFINNFVFGELMSRLTQNLSDKTQNLIWVPIEGVFFIAAIIILIVKRREVRSYMEKEKSSKGLYKRFFTAAWMLVYLILQFVSSLAGISHL